MSSDDASNKTKIWGFAAGAGVIAFLLLKFSASYSFWPALLLAVLIAILVAILLWIGFYRDPQVEGADAQPQRANLASGTMTTGTTGIAAPPTVTEPPTAKPVAAEKPAKPAKPAASPKPKAAKPAAAPKPKAVQSDKKADAKSGSAMMGDAGNRMVAEKKAAKATPATKPAAAGGKPDLLTAAREGGPDDLKQIKGVGPKLEGELHKMGVYHFDQVAGWTKKRSRGWTRTLQAFASASAATTGSAKPRFLPRAARPNFPNASRKAACIRAR